MSKLNHPTSADYPPPVLDHVDIKPLVEKWRAHYGREISGEVALEVNENNGIVVKKIIYYDHDFVRDILVKLRNVIDDNKRYHCQLAVLKARLEE